MANGKPSDPEEYVIRSGVRSGLKREFAFALKSQAELSPSLGRTRSGQPSPSPLPLPSLSSHRDPKRLKKSNSFVSPAVVVVRPSSNPIPLVEIDHVSSKVEPLPRPAPKQQEDDFKLTEEKAVVENPIVIDGLHEESEVDSASAFSVTAQYPTRTTDPPLPAPPAAVDGNAKPMGTDESLELDDAAAAEMVIDALKVESVTLEIESVPLTPVPESCAVDKPSVVVLEEDLIAAPPPPSVDNAGTSVETPVNMENGVPEKRTKRFTRSSLKVPQIEQEGSGAENPVVINYQDGTKDASCLPDKPARRFTRSLLKSTAEDTVAGGEVSATSTSGGSVGCDETRGGANVDDGSSSITPSKKMELKMSKKIALNKLPNNVRELLGTGLLEGLPVKYIFCVGRV